MQRARFWLMFAIVLLSAAAPQWSTHAQNNGSPPLVLGVQGELGRDLTLRLEAALGADSVVTTSVVFESAAEAAEIGRLRGAALVVWMSDTATVHSTIPEHTLFVWGETTFTSTLDLANAHAINAYVQLAAGQIHALAGSCGQGVRHLERALRSAPESWAGIAEAHFYTGICLAQQGNVAAALEQFDNAAQQVDRWYYWNALAGAHSILGESRLAIESATSALNAPDVTDLQRYDLLLNRAGYYELQNERPAVIDDLTAAIGLQPELPTAYRRRAEVLFQDGNFTAALVDYDRLVALLPDDPFMLAQRAEVLLALGDYEAALNDLQAGLALEPPNIDVYLFRRGLAYLYMGNFDAARGDFEAYTTARPEDPSGWINLGQTHEGAGNPLSAALAYETALDRAPGETHLYSTLARLYYEVAQEIDHPSDDTQSYLYNSINAANQALNANSIDTQAYLYRGLSHLQLRENEAALEDFNAALRLDPVLELALFNRGIAYTRLGDTALTDGEQAALYQNAIDDYQQLIDRDFEVWAYLLPYQAYLYIGLEAFEDALVRFAEYEAAYGEPFDDAEYLVYRARAYLGLEQFPEAITSLDAAAGAAPAERDVFFYRALAYKRYAEHTINADLRRERFLTATENYEVLIDMDIERNAYLLPYAGYLYVEAGDFAAAAAAFTLYESLEPEGLQSLDQDAHRYYLARASAGMGSYEEALAIYTALLEAGRGFYNCQAQRNAGIILGSVQQDQDTARNYLKTYLEDCTNNLVMENLVRFYLIQWPGSEITRKAR